MTKRGSEAESIPDGMGETPDPQWREIADLPLKLPEKPNHEDPEKVNDAEPPAVDSIQEQKESASDRLVREFYNEAEKLIGLCENNIDAIADEKTPDKDVIVMRELKGESHKLNLALKDLSKSISETDASLKSPESLRGKMRELGIDVDALNQKLEATAENLRSKLAETLLRQEEVAAKNPRVILRDIDNSSGEPKIRKRVRLENGEVRDATADDEEISKKYGEENNVTGLRNEILTFFRTALNPLLKNLGKETVK